MNLQKLIAHISDFVINNTAEDCPNKIDIAPTPAGIYLSWKATDDDILDLAHMPPCTTIKREHELYKKWHDIIVNLEADGFYVEVYYKTDDDDGVTDPKIHKIITKGYNSMVYPELDVIVDDIADELEDIIELRLYTVETLANGRRVQELVDCVSTSESEEEDVAPVEETESGPIRIKNIPKYSITEISDASDNISKFLRDEKHKILATNSEVYCMAHSYAETNEKLSFFREVCTSKRLAEMCKDPNSTSAESVHVKIDDVIYTLWKQSSIKGYTLFTTSISNYGAIASAVSDNDVCSYLAYNTDNYKYLRIGFHAAVDDTNRQIVQTYCTNDQLCDYNMPEEEAKKMIFKYAQKKVYDMIHDSVFYQVSFIEIYDDNDNLTTLFLPGTPQDCAFESDKWTKYDLT